MLSFIDSHCHIDFSDFDLDRNKVLDQCRQIGVETLIVPGVSPDYHLKLSQLCEADTSLFFSQGLHPWQIDRYCREENNLDQKQFMILMKAGLSHPKCLGVGEFGLDKTLQTPLEKQVAICRLHLAIAQAQNLPVIIHCVKLHHVMLELLDEFRSLRGVIHAFSGSEELAQAYIDRGFYLGAGGVITYERAQKTRRTFSMIGLDHILLETDAPAMPIKGEQGQRNSPLNLPYIAQTLADLKGVPIEQVAEKTKANTQKLFKL